MVATARWSRRAGLALLGTWLAAGCGPPAPEAVPMRPGDSVFGALDRVIVERFPPSSLSPDVAALAGAPGGVRVRTAEIPPEAWTAARRVPEAYAPWLAGHKDVRLFRLRPALPRAAPGAVPTILRDGAVVPDWDPKSQPFPGEFVYWDPGVRELRAAATAPPRGVRLEMLVDAGAELGGVELRLQGGTPTTRDLLRRVELGSVSRQCLLLPAPGELSLEVPQLGCSTLAVSVGVLDHSWRADNGTLQRAGGRSDGATFAVDVEADGRRQRVWFGAVDAAGVGARFVDAEVDLQAFGGRDVVLHLVSEPGPAGNADFDYAVWSDLRLLGAARPAPQRTDRRPNVVIIDADTLRPDRLGCYGCARPTSPRLDAWAAASGVRFTNVRSTGCYTLPATATMLTGLAVHQHRLGLGLHSLAASGAPTLAALLSAAGYETLGIAEGAYLSTAFGFDGGFDVYVTREQKQPGWELARQWLADRKARSERPVFLFLQTYTVHAPYDYDPRFLAPYGGPLAGQPVGIESVINPVREGRLALDPADLAYVNALYDAGVARMDVLAGDMIDALHALFADEDVLIVFVADHGEEFLEHGSLAHNHTLYNELLSVPLIVDFPGAGTPGSSGEPASLLDIVPTVLDVAGLTDTPDAAALPGRSLRAGPAGSRPRVAQYASGTHSVEFDGLKLIRGPIPGPHPALQLFDLRTDAGEQHDLAEQQPDSVARLGGLLDDWLRLWPAPAVDASADGTIDAGTLQDLRALGYTGDGDGHDGH